MFCYRDYQLTTRLNQQNEKSTSETYISLRQQELRTCKRTGYKFYCEELFVVKCKTSFSCESAIYFNLDPNVIKENCNFKYFFNKIDITPTILDGGNEIVLANGPMISISYAMSTMTSQLKFTHMF